MQVINHISYNDEHGFRGLGDLYLPDNVTPETKAALLIHGGGWCAMDKSSFAGVALWICSELGMVAYNINYRLCGQQPWPACGDDCLEGANFFLNADIHEFQGFDRKRIVVIGGSAGGHLALMTGLRLPTERVAGIVSISGIADMDSDRAMNPTRFKNLFGHEPSEDDLKQAAPITYHTKQSPPILCTHDRKDNVVPIESAKVFLSGIRANGGIAEEYFYIHEETGISHRIWIPDSTPHKLYPDIEEQIAKFIGRVM